MFSFKDMTDTLAGKKVVILGLARQGQALARYASAAGADVVASDMGTPEKLQEVMTSLGGLGIEYVLGSHPQSLLDGCDMLIISGGVPADLPIVLAARAMGIPISNDSQEFIRRCPTAVIGITGSAGKSTTTALTGAMGLAAGRQTWIGGNIGRPLIADLLHIQPGDLVVQELSSFQLELWQHSPAVAAVLNITPNHLDRHGTMAAYSDAKANILRYQSAQDIAVLCADDPGAMALEPLVHGRLRLFSISGEVSDGAFVRGDHVWLRDGAGTETAVCPLDLVRLRGRHNLLNICAAVTLADSAGIPVSAMRETISTFSGVPHRLELVATINGVTYINDSIATAPERALAALASFDEPVILLAGGKDKNMVWGAWAAQVNRQVKHVILFGALAEQLASTLAEQQDASARQAPVSIMEDLATAVHEAATLAEPGDIILLAPGGTSYDAYTDFEQRGEHFRALVHNQETSIEVPSERKAQ
jgi:UDP-N-acetylmuramoylalanine--D-glutamate ligase